MGSETIKSKAQNTDIAIFITTGLMRNRVVVNDIILLSSKISTND